MCMPVGCVHVCACVCPRGPDTRGNAAGEPHGCSTHHTHSVSLELPKADPFFLAVLLIEPIVPTLKIQGQSLQQGKAPCAS